MATSSVHRDPRIIITPDAFAVSEDLLGMPLAPPPPRKRGLPRLIDLAATMKALPRDERVAVAARIDHIAGTGLPAAMKREVEDAGAVRLPGGNQILL